MAQNYTLTNLHEFFDGDIIQRMIEMSIHIDRIVKLAELDFDLLKLNFIIIILVKKTFIFKFTDFTTLKNLKAKPGSLLPHSLLHSILDSFQHFTYYLYL